MSLEEACDLGTVLSRLVPTDIAPEQEVPMFLMAQATVTRCGASPRQPPPPCPCVLDSRFTVKARRCCSVKV
jgi:hypothetical protein